MGHQELAERREERSAMWRHARDKRGSLPNFAMSETGGVFGKDAMLRQITENRNIPLMNF